MAIILPLPDNTFECLCWATYKYYMCHCNWCNEINLIDVKWRLIDYKWKIKVD